MTTINVKISDLVQQYDGSGDFAEWIRKLELVSRLQKFDKLENYLPLFLSGGAFAVYEALDEAVKNDYSRLKAALTSAFSVNCFLAYEQLMHRRLDAAEPVDVYLADIRRLAGLVCPKPDDALIKCAFVCGLPEAAKCQLQAITSLDSLPLADVAARARTLMANVSSYSAAAARSRLPQPQAGHSARRQPAARRRCFVCGSETHLVRSCPQRHVTATDSAAPNTSEQPTERVAADQLTRQKNW